jgi:hypothetical protein
MPPKETLPTRSGNGAGGWFAELPDLCGRTPLRHESGHMLPEGQRSIVGHEGCRSSGGKDHRMDVAAWLQGLGLERYCRRSATTKSIGTRCRSSCRRRGARSRAICRSERPVFRLKIGIPRKELSPEMNSIALPGAWPRSCCLTHGRPPRRRAIDRREGAMPFLNPYAADSPGRLRQLASWYRDFAECAGSTAIWECRLHTAEDLDEEADRVERHLANKPGGHHPP